MKTITISPTDWIVSGPSQNVILAGRAGIRATSIHTRLSIGKHLLNEPKGTFRLWFASMDELAPSADKDWFYKRVWAIKEELPASSPNPQIYPLLADYEHPRDWAKASFAAVYSSSWYNNLVVKFHTGDIYGSEGTWKEFGWPKGTPEATIRKFAGPDVDLNGSYIKACCPLDHISLERLRWNQLLVTWDAEREYYAMALNGIWMLNNSESQNAACRRETTGETLYAGDPTIILGELTFTDQVTLDPLASYTAEGGLPPSAEFLRMHTGRGLATSEFSKRIQENWRSRLKHSLIDADIPKFKIEGLRDPEVVYCPTSDGLEIRTSPVACHFNTPATDHPVDEPTQVGQVYFWLPIVLEGDVAVRYQFKSLQRHGLSLLMTCATGLHGEDHHSDHRPRFSGSMRQVCWDEVRNYHWEYYRQMGGARQDVASHVLVKNPWLHPLAYQVQPTQIEVNTWHTLEFMKDGPRITGAIDEHIIFDVIDDPHNNNGPIFHGGRIAIRAMWGSHFRFKDLNVWDRPAAQLTLQ
jgi:hypothetical protein